jgi:murein DD-endopeptidase MepM/ murein hydrolase activator NlpD
MLIYQNTRTFTSSSQQENNTAPRRRSHTWMSILAGIAIATVTTIGLPFASQAFAEPSDTEIQTAQTQFDDAQRNFDVMKTERDNSNAQLHKTRQQAEDVKNKAKKASEIADEATRAYIRMLRDGSPVATLKLNDIQNDTTGMLNDFGIMGNDSAVTTNVRIGDQITQFRATSAALKQQLTEVENAVNTFPTEARNQDVANAENEVNLKRNHLEFLKNQRQPKAANGNPIIGGWVKPHTGGVTDNFGPRPEAPVPGVNPIHRGTDFAASCGSPIVAAGNGTVVEAGLNGTYGNWILVQHPDGSSTGYAHIEDGGYMVKVGDQVGVGQQIARAGTTGASTGCHLHFEVRFNGVQSDPKPFLADRGTYF